MDQPSIWMPALCRQQPRAPSSGRPARRAPGRSGRWRRSAARATPPGARAVGSTMSMIKPSSIPAKAKGHASTWGSVLHGLRRAHHDGKGELDEQQGAFAGVSAAMGWDRGVRQREPGSNTYQLGLMAARTVATVLDDGREQVVGGGREGIIAASTQHVRQQSAKDSGADTSRERGIDEISAW